MPNKIKVGRKPTLVEASIGFILLIAIIVLCFRLKTGMEMPLIVGTVFASIFGAYLGYSWNELQRAMITGITSSIMAIIILLLAGMLVGIWIIGGTVPSLIYYGLKMVSASIFLPFTFALCCATSLATGTSFGSIATVGLALFGVGHGLGVPPHITAGAIASGAFFGDKISPLSDTTVMSASICEVNIFEHIKSTILTTGPAAVIAFIIYAFIGSKYATGNTDLTTINLISDSLLKNYNITYITFIPPIAIIVLSVMKIPSVVALGTGVFLSILTAIGTQNLSVAKIFTAAVKGNVSDTGVQVVDKILNRGGMNMMSGMIIIFVIATAMSGILDKCQIVTTLVEKMLKVIKKPSSLIITTVISGYLSQALAPTMTFGIVFVGKTFAPAYKKLNVDARVLSRTIGDTVTLGNVLIPYGGAAVFLMGTLGLQSADFIPYAFLNILSPIIAIIYAITGIAVWPADENIKKVESDFKI